ncbi:UDP-N-acetylglucosamine 2-epimerase [Rheinheimera sp. 1928-s]|uniref:UDP-N-acetylglucosamine 2-epimerase n=1 Tax=Rheinheimera sp. 1928-s TaxID=3033803 RepID=UPI00261649BD|nr:UDP-N-acetylglucosamine 2-epimerase [Rheinheimera sp. 1928-s]MDF3125837.1 UDP-N-acetylglucosamine 2-epimerase [Rheinheimera sp. 1928-s]
MTIHKRRIAVFTGTRADYGLLYYVLRAIQSDHELELQLIVSGSHLSPEYGYTVQQIEQDRFEIAARIDMLLSADSAVATVKSMGLGLIGFADALQRLKPDLLVLLGDRYEALAVAQAAMLMHIPLFHLHGGELTEGAYDDAIRHAITKFSQYHATSTEVYRQRVIQLGESPERVFCVGAPGLEAIAKQTAWSRENTLKELGLPADAHYLLLTYHPETQDIASTSSAICNVLDACLSFESLYLIGTYPNADEGGRLIIEQLELAQKQHPKRIKLFSSLGQARYLAAVRHAKVVVGNSSSAVIEVPSLHVPSVNVGQRQAGRLAASSVLHCGHDLTEIKTSIAVAMQLDCTAVCNPYGDGEVSHKVVSLLKTIPLSSQKKFYDVPSGKDC